MQGNPDASRCAKLVELHFSTGAATNGGAPPAREGRIAGAKVLTYALDKSRLGKLTHEERTFHIFYQLLAGSTPSEREHLGLLDASEYNLLATSGCYRLPAGMAGSKSDDGVMMGEVREAMRVVGFKPRAVQSVLGILNVVMLLSNLEFGYASEGKAQHDEQAYIANPEVLSQIARLLSLDASMSPTSSELTVGAEELLNVLTNRTRYVRKEVDRWCRVNTKWTGPHSSDGPYNEIHRVIEDMVESRRRSTVDGYIGNDDHDANSNADGGSDRSRQAWPFGGVTWMWRRVDR